MKTTILFLALIPFLSFARTGLNNRDGSAANRIVVGGRTPPALPKPSTMILISVEGDSLSSDWIGEGRSFSWSRPLLTNCGPRTVLYNWAARSDFAVNMVDEYWYQAHTVATNPAVRKVFIDWSGINDVYNGVPADVVFAAKSELWDAAKADGYEVWVIVPTEKYSVPNSELTALQNAILVATNVTGVIDFRQFLSAEDTIDSLHFDDAANVRIAGLIHDAIFPHQLTKDPPQT